MTRPPAIFDTLVDRDYFPVWLNDHGLVGQIVEIGTFRGEYSAHLCQHYAGQVITVDPFLNDLAGYRDGCVANLDMEQVFDEAMERLRPWTSTGRCRLIRGLSVEVATSLSPESLEAVFVDGAHHSEAVRNDLEAYWPLLKAGGVMGFHDCYERHDALQDCGVWSVVWDWAHRVGQQPHLSPCSSAWFVKQDDRGVGRRDGGSHTADSPES